MARLSPTARLLLVTLFVALLTLAATAMTGGLSPSLIEPDEGGHYVNALFLGDWLRAGCPSPMPFAKAFYAHFPRLSIGHWPPGWYMVEAPFFAIVRPSPLQATYLSALLAGTPALAIVWATNRIGQVRLGISLAMCYALLPLTLDGARYVLVDQPLALVIALAVMAWFAASERPGWPRMLAFGLLAAACPLVKGNGALIALVPALDVALTRRWALLRQPSLWAAAALTLAIVAPWYWLSFRLSAEGFNYQPGFAYAVLAFQANLAAILANIGWGGMALGLVGAIAWRAPAVGWRIACLSVSVVLATLLFQSAVPASLVTRYCAPLLPWAVVLVGLGLAQLARLGKPGFAAGAALGALAMIPGLKGLHDLRPKPDIGAPALASGMVSRGGLFLVDGRSGGEGALIAAVAHADEGRRRVWIARASQWLSTSDFMGRGYQLTATTPLAARAILDRLGAAGAVSIAAEGRLAYPHSRILLGAMQTHGFDRSERPFRVAQGVVVEARRLGPVLPNAALLATDPMSAKAASMTHALD